MRKTVMIMAIAAFGLIASVASYPNLGTSRISGTVKNEKGEPLSGTLVSLTNLERHIMVSVMTQKSGAFQADSLSAGTYDVRAERAGYLASQKKGIKVARSAGVDLVLTKDL